MIFNCPECGQTLRAADDAAGKKCRCTSCKQLVPIPGGSPKTPSPSRPASPNSASTAKPAPKKTQPPGPKPSVASELDDMIVRQQEQFLEQAAHRHQQMAQAQRRAEQYARVKRYYTNNEGNFSPLRLIFSIIFVMGAVFTLGCCGFFGYAIYGRSTKLTVGAYSARASVSGPTQSKNELSVRGEGVANIFTGSEFWLIVIDQPPNQPQFVFEAQQRLASQSSSQQDIQRGNWRGKRYIFTNIGEFTGHKNTACEMEVFSDRGKLILMLYVRGSDKRKADLQSKSSWESVEGSMDNPESFFSSLSNE